MRNFRIFIPARLKSSRLPGKLLLRAYGKPLICWTLDAVQHVRDSNKISPYLMGVTILTDSRDIFETVESYCGRMHYDFRCSLRKKMPIPMNGTERIGFHLSDDTARTGDLSVNWQADEPLLEYKHIIPVVKDFDCVPGCDMQTIAMRGKKEAETVYPVVDEKVKFTVPLSSTDKRKRFVVKDFKRGFSNTKHIGLYAGTERFYLWYYRQDPTQQERERSLEQLRVIGRGGRVNISILPGIAPISINTRQDFDEFCLFLRKR